MDMQEITGNELRANLRLDLVSEDTEQETRI